MLKPKYDSYPGLAETTESVYATHQNSLKLSFSVEVWYNILTYTLDPFWVIIAPGKSAIQTPMHAASVSHNVYHISIADYGVTYEQVNTEVGWNILSVLISCTHFQCYSLDNADTILYLPTMFHFCPWLYGSVAVCSTNPPSDCLRFKYC